MLTGLFLLLSVFNVSFCSVNQKELSQMDSKYIIDLDGKQESEILLSSYFQNPKAIILETNKDCLIGHIFDLQVFDDFLYVLDTQIAKSLFVFDMNGRFVRKIGSLGQGPGEYSQLSDFTIDTEKKYIYLLDFNKRIHQYLFDGTFVRTITPKLEKTNIVNIYCCNNRLFMSVLAYNRTPNDYMLMETDLDNGEILSQSLPLKYNKGWGESIYLRHSSFLSRSNVMPLYTRMFMDYIVSVGEDITPYIELRSKNLVTDKDVVNIVNAQGGARAVLGRFRDYVSDHSKIYDVHSFVENNEFILFRYQRGIRNYHAVILDKKTGLVKLANQFSNDLIYKNGENHFFNGFLFSNTKGSFDILHIESIARFQESIRNNEVVSRLDRLDELRTLEEEANPVIFYYEYK